MDYSAFYQKSLCGCGLFFYIFKINWWSTDSPGTFTFLFYFLIPVFFHFGLRLLLSDVKQKDSLNYNISQERKDVFYPLTRTRSTRSTRLLRCEICTLFNSHCVTERMRGQLDCVLFGSQVGESDLLLSVEYRAFNLTLRGRWRWRECCREGDGIKWSGWGGDVWNNRLTAEETMSSRFVHVDATVQDKTFQLLSEFFDRKMSPRASVARTLCCLYNSSLFPAPHCPACAFASADISTWMF